MRLANCPVKFYLFHSGQGIPDRSRGGQMLKGLFGKPTGRTKIEGAGLSLHENELLKYYVREYCLQRHICLKKMIDMMEREIIYLVLEEAHGNQRKAARLLGVKPNTLHYKIQRMGLVPIHKYMLPD